MSGIQIVSFVLYLVMVLVHSIVLAKMGHGIKSWKRWLSFCFMYIVWIVAYKA